MEEGGGEGENARAVSGGGGGERSRSRAGDEAGETTPNGDEGMEEDLGKRSLVDVEGEEGALLGRVDCGDVEVPAFGGKSGLAREDLEVWPESKTMDHG